MKLAHPAFSEVISLDGHITPTVVIENKRLFRTLICDFRCAIEGSDNNLVLSKNEKIIELSKNAELLTDFVHFNINKKPLLNKIIAELEKAAVSSEHYVKTQEFLSKVERTVDEWAFSFPCDIVSSKISVSTILKAAGVEIRNEYEGHIGEVEKIFDYMELVREFDRDKLFVTVNMRAYFDDEIITEFLKTVSLHECKVLMVESQAYALLAREKRITIDADLCEF
ncbi:MAG: type II-A CRISPR-associated protein Csn2 [Clostridiales bacterium]|nr:type II-A CRISPR-associated protein Csn2 [Clostridiales bacterium]